MGLLIAAVIGLGLWVWRWSGPQEKKPAPRPFQAHVKDDWKSPQRSANEAFELRRDNYRRAVVAGVKAVVDRIEGKVPAVVDRRNVREVMTLAYCAARLHQSTNDDRYLGIARKAFKGVLKAWQDNPDLRRDHVNPFFVAELLPQVDRYLRLRGHPVDRPVIDAYLLQMRPDLGREDNQDLAFAVGLTHLMSNHPDHANFGRWRTAVKASWSKWHAYRDNIENASTYSAIGWNAAMALARNLGLVDLLREPRLRAVFDRLCGQVMPSGAIPNYGDSYFGRSWTYWVLLLENAERVYGDRRMGKLAARVFWWGNQNQPIQGSSNGERNLAELVRLKPLADLLGWQFAGEPMPTRSAENQGEAGEFLRSQVWKRRVSLRDERWDKVLLSSGSDEPQALMLDLFGTGYHGHHNRRGALLYYESDGIPLFHSLDRHNKSLEDANSFVVLGLDRRETFPSNHRLQTQGWVTERIPLSILADDLGRREPRRTLDLRQLVLRFSAKRRTNGVLIDNFRLTGPNGPMLLDDFETVEARPGSSESSSKWRGDYRVLQAQGENRCMQIGSDIGVTFVSSTDWFPRKVSLTDYTHLEYDWRDKSAYQRNRLLLRVYHDNRLGHSDFDARNQHAYPVLNSCRTWVEGTRARCRLEMSDYKVAGGRLHRFFALLPSGPLIIVDRFYLPEKSQPQWVGPVWNFHSSYIQQTQNWFVTPSGERNWYAASEQRRMLSNRNLLVWFEPGESCTIGRRSRRLHANRISTAFSRKKAQPGAWTSTAVVAFPLSQTESAKELAAAIRVDRREKGCRVWLDTDSVTEKVEFNW